MVSNPQSNKSTNLQLFRKFDWYLIIAVAAVVGVFLFFRHLPFSSYSLQIKTRDGEQEMWITPGRSETLVVDGPLGKTTIQIQEGKVWVTDSPCQDKICIHMGKIPDNGGFIACLPNKVILRSVGKTGE
ncbi:MAG: NusG domain II-containing protein [Candidatus Atribacteria bacterium]|nr:NusG domain II-containing protein [Candidatus Atribacteria bacterium]